MRSRIQLDATDAIAQLRKIPIPSLRYYLLPEIDPKLLRFPHLTVRIQNCLRHLFQQGSIAGPGDLHNHTVGELLDTPNFGVKSLFDLLDALKPFSIPVSQGPGPEAPPASGNHLRTSDVDIILTKKVFVPSHIGNLFLPKIAASVNLKNLPLKARTRGCLEKLSREGLITEAPDLSKIEISHLLRRANFGKLTFIDLLTGLRPYMLDGDQLRTSAPIALLNALEKLRNSSLCAKVRCDDPRFKHELLALITIANSGHSSATLPTEGVVDLATRLSAAAFSEKEATRALLAIKNLRHGIRRALHLRLERELFELVRSDLDERTASIVSRVYGLDGRGSATLQEAGHEYDLTRERIRQICNRMGRLVKLQPFVPKLEMCIKFITSRLPDRADNIEQMLVEHRLTQAEFRLEGIRRAAELFNKNIRFDVSEINGVRIAVKSRKPTAAFEIMSIANRTISKSGVCAVSDIAESLNEERESVIGVLGTKSTVRWLTEDKEWFVIIDSKRNRLLNLVTKVTAVTPTIAVGELRMALSRNYRLGIVPPRSVLAEFCRELGWRVDADLITSPSGRRADEVLSETERTMTAILEEHGPVLYRTEFQELCARKGISRNTFSMYLWTNPVISRVAVGVYALTGAHLSPFEVENCLRRNRAPLVTLADCGWTGEARPWIALQMSPAMVASGVFAVPASIRDFLLGRFLVETADGTEVGKIQVAEQHSWGLGTLIRRREVEPGDFVVLEFNLQERRVKALLGGPELVESFCDAGSV